jgi:hypothetical protein
MLLLYLALPLRFERCIAVLLTSCLATESEAPKLNISKIRHCSNGAIKDAGMGK